MVLLNFNMRSKVMISEMIPMDHLCLFKSTPILVVMGVWWIQFMTVNF